MALRAAELDEDVQLPAPNRDRQRADVFNGPDHCFAVNNSHNGDGCGEPLQNRVSGIKPRFAREPSTNIRFREV